ncbi:uncharacterized protein [Miscanthus floridulus]|uniref:uncharacterized protein n=1 Tax=Miscanthus floridulus TaxID=154761 RepID=UPI0034578D71
MVLLKWLMCGLLPRKKNLASSNSASYRRMAKDNRNFCHTECLDQMGELITNDLILLPTSSSHVGEDLDGEDLEDTDDKYMEGEDMAEDMNEDMYEEDKENEENRDEEDIDNNNGGSNAGSNIDDFCDLGYIYGKVAIDTNSTWIVKVTFVAPWNNIGSGGCLLSFEHVWLCTVNLVVAEC